MLYVADVRARYDEIVDEPDQTFLTVAMRRQHLSDGYDEFRRQVRMLDPHMYIIEQDIVLAQVSEFDLALTANPVRLLGNPAAADIGFGLGLTGPRLMEIDTIGVLQGTEVIALVLEAQQIRQVLPNTSRFIGLPWAYYHYRLINTRLMFDASVNDTIRVYYIGESQVDWTDDDPTVGGYTPEFIDDLTDFHELIALYAAERYTLMDGSKRRELTEERQRVEQQMTARLQWGRSGTASSFVNDEYRG